MERQALVDSEEDELVRLLIRERVAILSYIRSIVFSHHLAEDIYQNVAVVVLRKREGVDRKDELLRWVFGVARLEALTALRKRGGTPASFDDHLLDLLDQTWNAQIERRSEDGFDIREALEHCMKQLTDRARQILRFRYEEGLSGEALAAKLDMKLNTAYVGLSRIHKQLRQCVDSAKQRHH